MIQSCHVFIQFFLVNWKIYSLLKLDLGFRMIDLARKNQL
uniref:Uncharacterized protein n=1 Tax=Prochlorococcus marinus str. P0902-H212 TaxID=1620696 RepID=A0A0D5A3D6_PROMR|nr:hypothetical protein FA02_0537 [Prochlorococcus marinus str. P0902-H212]